MQLMRSILFVPAHREGWAEKAVARGADGVFLDLEDSVPTDMKEEARGIAANSIRSLAGMDRKVGIYVRVNALETGMTGDDIEKVLVPGLNGFLLPKIYSPRDVISLDALVTHYERRNGVEAGTIELILPLETAQAFGCCEELIAASPRVATLFAGTAKDADVSRSVGFQFTPQGLETLYMRSRALLAVRAAGLQFPIVGLWQDLKDDEGALAFAKQNRELGFRGQVLIHPGHIEMVNRIYSPSADDVAFYAGMIAAFEEAEAKGIAAVEYEGQHIDYAHVKTAREVLALHEQLTSKV